MIYLRLTRDLKSKLYRCPDWLDDAQVDGIWGLLQGVAEGVRNDMVAH